MTTSNPNPMKTQIARSSLAAAFFPVFPGDDGKTGGVNGYRPVSRPDFRLRLEPVRAKHISTREPAPHDHSALPASLEDWLASNAALVIRRKNRAERKTPTPAALTPVAVRV